MTNFYGDCLSILPTINSDSTDFVFMDPPYPEIRRDYGKMNINEWEHTMHDCVKQCRRILKPKGSMAIVLQTNSEHVGQMRPWLWDFMSWCCREWNVVQDFYWINSSVCPTVHTKYGLMRGAVKNVVWIGDPDCYRNQDQVLVPLAESTKRDKRINSNEGTTTPSGHHMNHGRCLRRAVSRGGATPFNYITVGNNGRNKHSASTPYKLTEWWVKYCSKEGDLVVDPFSGSNTTGRVCKDLKRQYIGIEANEKYYEMGKNV